MPIWAIFGADLLQSLRYSIYPIRSCIESHVYCSILLAFWGQNHTTPLNVPRVWAKNWLFFFFLGPRCCLLRGSDTMRVWWANTKLPKLVTNLREGQTRRPPKKIGCEKKRQMWLGIHGGLDLVWDLNSRIRTGLYHSWQPRRPHGPGQLFRPWWALQCWYGELLRQAGSFSPVSILSFFFPTLGIAARQSVLVCWVSMVAETIAVGMKIFAVVSRGREMSVIRSAEIMKRKGFNSQVFAVSTSTSLN